MQFDWVTFLLEFVNFLVLVWLLTRFFYKPVRNVIEARKKSIEHKIAEAEKTRTEADAAPRNRNSVTGFRWKLRQNANRN